MVGTSPAQASTTSGSPPPSLVANFHVMRREQCPEPHPCSTTEAGVFAAGHNIHVIAAAQAMVKDAEEAVESVDSTRDHFTPARQSVVQYRRLC